MHIRTFLLLFSSVILLIPDCSKPKKISGKEFIDKEVFVDVLVDIHLIDGITNDRKFFRRYSDVDSIDVLGPILEKHHVTKEMFDTTMVVYTRHPELFDEVYDEVLSRLNMMLDDIDRESGDVESTFGLSKPEG
jgi:hypothetical protein